jgi:hypothetical protein
MFKLPTYEWSVKNESILNERLEEIYSKEEDRERIESEPLDDALPHTWS